MSLETAARLHSEKSAHFYLPDGTPLYEVPYADPSKGMRAATLADARKVGAYVSVTTVTRVLDRPGLNEWRTEQAVLAVLSTPQKPGESLDEYVHRVLQVEKVQEQESAKARDLGTQIHDALSNALSGRDWDKSLSAFVDPVVEWARATGRVVWTEKVLVGEGYAGRADLLLDQDLLNCLVVTDFKTTGKLPEKDSWPEHKLQTAAYAKAYQSIAETMGVEVWGKRIITGNVYISTKEPGQFKVFTQDDWQRTYACGFRPVLDYYMWANNYYPGRKI